MPDKMPEDMSDRMPEDVSVTKRINVMVGITRSKVILLVSFFLRVCVYLLTPVFHMKRLGLASKFRYLSTNFILSQLWPVDVGT